MGVGALSSRVGVRAGAEPSSDAVVVGASARESIVKRGHPGVGETPGARGKLREASWLRGSCCCCSAWLSPRQSRGAVVACEGRARRGSTSSPTASVPRTVLLGGIRDRLGYVDTGMVRSSCC